MNIDDIYDVILNDIIKYDAQISDFTWSMYRISSDILSGVITMKGGETIETTNAWY